MTKNTKGQTKRLIKQSTPDTKILREKLLDLTQGESVMVAKKDWPFKSNPAEYLYTLRRVGRIYSYMTIDLATYLIVRNK